MRSNPKLITLHKHAEALLRLFEVARDKGLTNTDQYNVIRGHDRQYLVLVQRYIEQVLDRPLEKRFVTPKTRRTWLAEYLPEDLKEEEYDPNEVIPLGPPHKDEKDTT